MRKPWIIVAIIAAILIGWLFGSRQVEQLHQIEMPITAQEPPCRNPLPASFQQIGLLTPSNGGENKILPLYARRLHRDRWQYYAVSNQHNDIKLPVRVGKKSALDEYGVAEQYTGDRVYVDGYNETFDVKLYETCLR